MKDLHFTISDKLIAHFLYFTGSVPQITTLAYVGILEIYQCENNKWTMCIVQSSIETESIGCVDGDTDDMDGDDIDRDRIWEGIY